MWRKRKWGNQSGEDTYSYYKNEKRQCASAVTIQKYPYLAEYATSPNLCRGCWSTIATGALQFAVNVQSLKEDEKEQRWYHFKCFFERQRPKNTFDIHNFESLKIKDQKKIQANVGLATFNIVPDSESSVKGIKQKALRDYVIEYAKSGRAVCRGCLQKIIKGEIRVSKKSYDTDIGKKFDGQDMWHHLSCFVAIRGELGYFESGSKLPGFGMLQQKDQDFVVSEILPLNPNETDIVKSKTKSEIPEVTQDKINNVEYKAQNKLLYRYRNQLNKLNLKDLTDLIRFNNQELPENKTDMLDRLADAMAFGALLPCKNCKGQLVFENGGYVCTGTISEWAYCDVSEKEPARKAFVMPRHLSKKKLADYTYQPRNRIILTGARSSREIILDKPKVEKEPPALYDMLFVILGKPPKGKDEIKQQIISMGGKVITKIDEKVAAIISTPEEVHRMNMRMKQAVDNEIHVVPDSFLDEAKNHVGKIGALITEKCICDWGSNVQARLPTSTISKYRSMYTKTATNKVKMTLTLV